MILCASFRLCGRMLTSLSDRLCRRRCRRRRRHRRRHCHRCRCRRHNHPSPRRPPSITTTTTIHHHDDHRDNNDINNDNKATIDAIINAEIIVTMTKTATTSIHAGLCKSALDTA